VVTDLREPPAARTAAAEAMADEERYRWALLGVVLVGTLMVVLDTTIVNVALPVIRDDLRAGDGIEWVVTAYLLAVAASQPACAWLADRFGRKQIFLTSLVTFTIASLCCGLAPNLATLVVFRAIQGVGGGAMMPVGMAMVFEVFPPERRGQAIGIWGVSAMAGPAIGPTLGGWLVTTVSWHWLFLVNVPVGAVGLVLGLRVLRDSGHRDDRRLDIAGLVLGAGGLTLGLLGVSQSTQWGWGSPATLGCIGVGVAMLVAFTRHELRTPSPIVELRMFRSSVFAISVAVIVFTSAAQFTRLVFIPLELEGVRGYTALRVGVLLIPQALATAAAMPLGGRLVDRVGARVPVVTGCVLMAVATFLMGRLTPGTPIAWLVVVLCLQGCGMGLTMAPATVAGMNALAPEFVAQASAVRSLASQVAGAVAISALSALVASRMGGADTIAEEQSAFNAAFLVASALMVVATVLAFRLPHRVDRARGGEPVVLLE
jgi:EmrB/QacA subfamily drug resistance transporter